MEDETPKKAVQDEDLLTAIKAAESLAEDGELRQERIDSLNQYLGEAYGNEVVGRSAVVDRTIQSTVEWIKPILLKTFCSGDETVRFNPTSPEDIHGAELETDYCNYVLNQQNNFFSICYEWFTDALIQKTGYTKAFWDESDDLAKEEYKGLTDDEFAFIVEDPAVEIIEHEESLDEAGNAQREQAIQQLQQAAQQNPQARQQLEQVLKTPQPKMHEVTVRRNGKGKVTITCIPPEQVLVSHNATNISVRDTPFFEHWEWKTISQLRQEGFDVDDDIGDNLEGNNLFDWATRGDPLYWQKDATEEADPSMRRVKVREIWIRYDADDDGKAELLHCIVVGNTILEQEEVDFIPVAALTPQLMPHRHTGLSIADSVADLQLIKTVLLRGFIDNLFLSNNGRYGIDVDKVSIEDMLTSRPGGLVRTTGNPAEAIFPLVHQTNFAPVLQGLSYIDDAAESRTGITKYTQGLDANNLNKTATGVQAVMSAAQEKVMLICRVFAETGVKELMYIVHALVRKHQNKPEMVRLKNDWVAVDPRNWTKRLDATVTVGLGTGNKQEQLAHLANLFQMQVEALKLGLPVVQPQNVHETLKQIAKNAGFRQPEQFVSDPKELPPQQQQQDPQLMAKQMELQHDQQKTQMQAQLDQQKTQQEMQMKQQEAQMTLEIERHKSAAQLQQEQLRSQNDMQIEREKLQMQGELERFKAQLKAETELKIAALQYEMQQRQAETDMQVKAQDQMMTMAMHNQKMEAMMKPKTVKRDASGRVAGIE